MLRDAAGFPFRHFCLANRIEERRLPMIDVSHDGHDRRSRLRPFITARLNYILQQLIPDFLDRYFNFDSAFLGENRCGIEAHRLMKRQHLTHIHQLPNDVRRPLTDQLSEFFDRRPWGDFHTLPAWFGDFPRGAMVDVLGSVIPSSAPESHEDLAIGQHPHAISHLVVVADHLWGDLLFVLS